MNQWMNTQYMYKTQKKVNYKETWTVVKKEILKIKNIITKWIIQNIDLEAQIFFLKNKKTLKDK